MIFTMTMMKKRTRVKMIMIGDQSRVLASKDLLKLVTKYQTTWKNVRQQGLRRGREKSARKRWKLNATPSL